MNDKNRIEQEIKLIDQNTYCFEKYELDAENKFITLQNFHHIKSINNKLDLILELENGYPTNGHIWVHLPTEYFSQLQIQFNNESCTIHTSCTRTSCRLKSWIPSKDINNGDGIHTLIKEVTKMFFNSHLK